MRGKSVAFLARTHPHKSVAVLLVDGEKNSSICSSVLTEITSVAEWTDGQN